MNLTPPPPSQNSHAVRWYCTAESELRVAEIKSWFLCRRPTDQQACDRVSKGRPDPTRWPNDSTATGWKMWWTWMFEYFAVLRVTASSAAEPASRAAAATYESANGQMTVTSQVRSFPASQGTTGRPSGRFPLLLLLLSMHWFQWRLTFKNVAGALYTVSSVHWNECRTRARRSRARHRGGGAQARQRWVKSLPPDTRLSDRSASLQNQ